MTFEELQHQSNLEWDEPARKRRRSHSPRRSDVETISIDLDLDLPGAIYGVPDKMWGIAAPGRDWHPGICIFTSGRTNEALLVKGTSQALIGDLSAYFLLDPTDENGLRYPTAFNLKELFRFPRPRIALLHFGRLLGRLHRRDLIDLQENLSYLCCSWRK